ncbi:cell wall-binding repeat-containing protein [Pseudalkalibacillus sp. Hm43]|uniref:cell wall-binding repeat-containing protein n=1 Tax=Pseudalkalibacillus sp. Hm43 TaxID=3450742 RepID=UPI003F435102
MKNKGLFLVVIGLALLLILTIPKSASAIHMDRISGENRYETAVEISQNGWPDGSNTVVLARGYEFPDAIAGAPLAYQEDAPILLTDNDYLTQVTKDEIERLEANRVILLGGEAALSSRIESELNSMGLETKRISGKNRYETSVEIARELGSSDTAVVAYGGNYPDALSAAPYAARQGFPILLTRTNEIPSAVNQFKDRFNKSYILGGHGVISESVANDFNGAERLAGGDRFETSKEILEVFQMGDADEAYVATGYDFADALTGSILAAKTNDPILLAEKNYVPNPTKLYVDDRGLNNFTVFGGYNAIDQYVDTELANPIQLLLVNKRRNIPASYEPERLVEPNVRFSPNVSENDNKRLMNSIAEGHLERLFDAAWNDGMELYAQSGYRSYERQQEIHRYYTREYGEDYADRVSAEPGHSEHQTGLAMDVTSPAVNYQLVEEFGDTEEGRWVERNAHRFGFIIRYPEGEEDVTGYKYEPWHLRYVGESVARYMKANNKVLEEYLR